VLRPTTHCRVILACPPWTVSVVCDRVQPSAGKPSRVAYRQHCEHTVAFLLVVVIVITVISPIDGGCAPASDHPSPRFCLLPSWVFCHSGSDKLARLNSETPACCLNRAKSVVVWCCHCRFLEVRRPFILFLCAFLKRKSCVACGRGPVYGSRILCVCKMYAAFNHRLC